MKNTTQSFEFYYDERLEDIVIAKDLLFKSVAPLKKKHRDAFLSYRLDGESKSTVAFKCKYALSSLPVIVSKTGKKVRSNLENFYNIEN
jgi:hypothetical protein